MLVLVPGKVNDPIHVKLIHKVLSDIPQCSALSYEWRAPTREAEIFCNGKILKVTLNLVAALKRLRAVSNKKPRMVATTIRSANSQPALSSTETSSVRDMATTRFSSFVSTLLRPPSTRHRESTEIIVSPVEPVLDPEEIEADVKLGLFWVDAICINQEDLDERFFSLPDLVVPT